MLLLQLHQITWSACIAPYCALLPASVLEPAGHKMLSPCRQPEQPHWQHPNVGSTPMWHLYFPHCSCRHPSVAGGALARAEERGTLARCVGLPSAF